MDIPSEAIEAILARDPSWPEEYDESQRAVIRTAARRDLEAAAPILMSVAWSYGVRDGERNAALGTYAGNPYKTHDTDEETP